MLAAATCSAPHAAVLEIDLPGAQPGHLLRALQVGLRGFPAKDAPAGDLVD